MLALGSSGARRSWRSAGAWSATSPDSRRPPCCAACPSCRSRPRCWRRWIERRRQDRHQHPHGKNLLGAFHQPIAVLADTDVLATLPPRELRAGYAEIVKAGLIGDAALFAWCEANGAALLAGDARAGRGGAARLRLQGRRRRRRRARGEAQRRPRAAQPRPHLRPRAGGRDGLRRHAAARRGGRRSGWCWRSGCRRGSGCASRRRQRGWSATSSGVGLKSTIAECGRPAAATALLAHMRRDKKMRDGRLAFVLVRGIGHAFTSRDVEPEDVLAVLAGQPRRMADMSPDLSKT